MRQRLVPSIALAAANMLKYTVNNYTMKITEHIVRLICMASIVLREFICSEIGYLLKTSGL